MKITSKNAEKISSKVAKELDKIEVEIPMWGFVGTPFGIVKITPSGAYGNKKAKKFILDSIHNQKQ